MRTRREQTDGAGAQTLNLARRYLHGPAVDQVMAQEDVPAGGGAGAVLWQLGDNQGSTRDVVDSSGVVVTHLVYDSFGKLVSGSATTTRYLYTDREWDADVGLQYNRARWYDPASGRWLSEDPIGFAGGDANLSRYVGNGATNAMDPSGLAEEPPDEAKVSTFEEFQQGFEEFRKSHPEALDDPSDDYRRREMAREAYIHWRGTSDGFDAWYAEQYLPNEMEFQYQLYLESMARRREEQLARFYAATRPVIQPSPGTAAYDQMLRREAAAARARNQQGHGFAFRIFDNLLNPKYVGLGNLDDMACVMAPFAAGHSMAGARRSGDLKAQREGAGKTHGHHSDPKFMGGDPKQRLTDMPIPSHQKLHQDLNDFLREKTDAAGNHMRPQRGNPGAKIRRNFSREERLKAEAEFYKKFGNEYPDAARDFFDQHPGLK